MGIDRDDATGSDGGLGVAVEMNESQRATLRKVRAEREGSGWHQGTDGDNPEDEEEEEEDAAKAVLNESTAASTTDTQSDFFKPCEACVYVVEISESMFAPYNDPNPRPQLPPANVSPTQAAADEAEGSASLDPLSGTRAGAAAGAAAEGGRTTIFGEVISAIGSACRVNIIARGDVFKAACIFAGVSNGTKEINCEGIHTVMPLDYLSLHSIRSLTTLASEYSGSATGGGSDNNLTQKFKLSKFGALAPYKCSDLMQLVNKFIKDEAPQKRFRSRVIIFTAEDDPCKGNEKDRSIAWERAAELHKEDVDIEVICLRPEGGTPFNLDTFYRRIMRAPPSSSDDSGDSPSSDAAAAMLRDAAATKLEDMREMIRSKAFPQRRLLLSSLHLQPGYAVPVSVFSEIVATRTKPHYALRASDHQLLQTETKWICDDTGALLEPEDVETVVHYGGERVRVTREERQRYSCLYPPGIHLLGFKPVAKLLRHHASRPPFFLAPSETRTTGGAKAFTALLYAMVNKQQMAVVRFSLRPGSVARLAALLPQDLVEGCDGRVLEHPGFHLLPLASAEDIRELTLPEPWRRKKVERGAAEAEKDLQNPQGSPAALFEKSVALAGKLLTALVSTELLGDVYNPHIQRQYEGIEAIALREKTLLESKLDTDVDAEGIQLREPKIKRWKDSLEAIVPFSETTPKQKTTAATTRKRKAPDGTAPSIPTDMEDMIMSPDRGKLTVGVLKEYLKAHSLPVGGKKDDLLKRAFEHVSKKRREDAEPAAAADTGTTPAG
eukprot:GHVU01196913.1.p1 GENE.GHVU01196913.1~~GHVU01196913.1.p1  ORF type:complete len:780 (+),score=198.96 GHVU01196913.1:141-2480(+)